MWLAAKDLYKINEGEVKENIPKTNKTFSGEDARTHMAR
jgi:hypothetical protein